MNDIEKEVIDIFEKQLNKDVPKILKKYNFEHSWYGRPEQHNEYGKEILEYILKKFPDRQIKIIDLGCGVGLLSLKLAKLGYINVVGIDYERKFVKAFFELTTLYKLPIKEIIFGNLHNFYKKYKENLELIIGLNFSHQVDCDSYEVLKNASKKLTKNGKIIMSFHLYKETKIILPEDFHMSFDFQGYKGCYKVFTREYLNKMFEKLNLKIYDEFKVEGRKRTENFFVLERK